MKLTCLPLTTFLCLLIANKRQLGDKISTNWWSDLSVQAANGTKFPFCYHWQDETCGKKFRTHLDPHLSVKSMHKAFHFGLFLWKIQTERDKTERLGEIYWRQKKWTEAHNCPWLRHVFDYRSIDRNRCSMEQSLDNNAKGFNMSLQCTSHWKILQMSFEEFLTEKNPILCQVKTDCWKCFRCETILLRISADRIRLCLPKRKKKFSANSSLVPMVLLE